MRRYVIQLLDEGASAPPSIPGQQTTIILPNVPHCIVTWQDFLRWLTMQSGVFDQVTAGLFPLVDEPGFGGKPPENPGPPR